MQPKKYSPLTQYIYWLRNNQPFPEDANSLYIGTLLNLSEDDFTSCVYFNSLINEDLLTFYNTKPHMFGELHKQVAVNKTNLQYIRSSKPNIQLLKEIRRKYPHLKLSDIELFLNTTKDQDSFLESIGLKDIKVSKTEKTFALLHSILESTYKNSNQFYITNAQKIEDVAVILLGNTATDIIPVIDVPYISTYLSLETLTNENINKYVDVFTIIRSMVDRKTVIVPYTIEAINRLGITEDNMYKSIFMFENNRVVPITSKDDIDRLELVVDIVNDSYKPRVRKANKKTIEDTQKYLQTLNIVDKHIVVDDVAIWDVEESIDNATLNETLENTLNDFMENMGKPKEEKIIDIPKEIVKPIENPNGVMLVDTIYRIDKENGDVAYQIFRNKNKKIINEIDTFVDVYYSDTETKSVMPIDRLNKRTIKYSNRWFFMKDNPHAYNADLSFAVHKNVEWRANNEETLYKLRLAIIDIEIYTGNSILDFSKLASEATKFPINMVTIYDNYENTCYTYVYNINKSTINKDNILKRLEYDLTSFELYEYDNEFDMLTAFLDKFNSLEVDLCSGWNTEQFDLPYIYYRFKSLNVEMDWSLTTFNKRDREYVDVDVPFVYNVDYLRLYKEMSFGERESFKLGFIANHELNISKVDLDANMTEVFDNDIDTFIAYNINDVYLIKLLDDKLKYIELMHSIVQIANVSWKEGYTTLRLIDGLIYNYLYNKNMAFTVRKENQTKEALLGAYVRTPNKGIYEWVCDFDLASLYPFIIARYNLFTDTYVGKIDEDLMYEFMYHRDKFLNRQELLVSLSNGQVLKTTTQKFENWISNRNYIVTIAGTIFMSHEEELSMLYEVIDMLIRERNKYKDMMFEAIKNEDTMLVDRYNNMQTTYKVLTNSLYGAMANEGFRFFSNEITQSITKTGREISKMGSYMVDSYLKKMEAEKNIEAEFIDIDKDFLIKAEEVLDTIIYGDSVVGNTKISINGTEQTIEAFWDSQFANKNKDVEQLKDKQRMFLTDTYTTTIDKHNNAVETYVDYIMKHKTDKQLYKITTASGKTVTVTEDESIMIVKDGNVVECTPKDLIIGDKTLIKN